MKIVMINSVGHGSTGKIMRQVADEARMQGHEVYICLPNGRHNKLKTGEGLIYIGGRISEDLHIIMGRLTGLCGCFSILATLRFILKLKKIAPDVIHMHNLHNCYINLPILFNYIKRNNIKIVWTLHDCWAFTGQCPYFDLANCGKWQKGCYNCCQHKRYPKTYVDQTRLMWKLKRKLFTGIQDMTIVTPSKWLKNLAMKSYLNEYNIMTINNGIDLNVFKPVKSSFREIHDLGDKYVVLGVALGWEERKGLDVFIELSKWLNEKYQIVLVGTDSDVDRELPDNIISIHRTQNQQELAEIYSAANLLVNPTREENYPTVNMEAVACGTPVLTFKTGGSPEMLDETCGVVVEKNDVKAIKREVVRLCEQNIISKQDCLKKAISYDMNKRFKEYVKIFEL